MVLVVVSNVVGSFTAGETITGGTSSVTDVIQSDAIGMKGVREFDFSRVKQLVWQVLQLILPIHH